MTRLRSKIKSKDAGQENFDHFYIYENETVNIPNGQESEVHDFVDIDGTLNIDGRFYIEEDSGTEGDPVLVNPTPAALSYAGTDNFGYVESYNVLVPAGQEMIVSDKLSIKNIFTVRGNASIKSSSHHLPMYDVDSYEIPSQHEMRVSDKLTIRSGLRVSGKAVIGSNIDEPFSYSRTIRKLHIPFDREMHVYGRFTADKDLQLNGKLRVA